VRRKLSRSTITAVILIGILAALIIFIAVYHEIELGHVLVVYTMSGAVIWSLAVELEKHDAKAKEVTKRRNK
jgi:type IV secretory pathway TrbD component